LIKDKQLREQMGARGKTKAMQYDWPLLAKKILDFYTATLNRIKRPEAPPEKDNPKVSAISGKY